MTTPPDPKKRFLPTSYFPGKRQRLMAATGDGFVEGKFSHPREFMCGTNGFEPTFRGAVGISRNLVRRLLCSRVRPADEVPGDAASPPSCCRLIAVITTAPTAPSFRPARLLFVGITG